jgi:hypothetical protein
LVTESAFRFVFQFLEEAVLINTTGGIAGAAAPKPIARTSSQAERHAGGFHLQSFQNWPLCESRRRGDANQDGVVAVISSFIVQSGGGWTFVIGVGSL